MSAPQKLLIVKLSSIGDVLHALPVVESIKKELPDLSIGWAVRRRCLDLVKDAPFINRIHVVEKKMGLSQWLKLSSEMKQVHYETAFDMQGLFISGLVSLLSGARRRVGLDLNREMNRLFLTEPVVAGRDKSRHAVDILSGFRQAAGLQCNFTITSQDYLAGKSATDAADPFSGLPHPVIALNVGASTIYKRWPVENWADLSRRLIAMGFGIVLTAGPQEVDDARTVAEAVGRPGQLRNLGGQTSLQGLASVLGLCDLVISGDTGPMHLAATLGTPTVGLFGPTDPRRTGPYGSEHQTIWKQIPCSPCFRHPTCGGRVDCLKAITVDDVVAAVQGRFALSPAACE